MTTLMAWLAWPPALRSILALGIALLVAACTPGGKGGSGY